MSSRQDDELTLLWQQGTSTEPVPEEIARLAGRASMRRFDRMIFWRNFQEYAAGLVFLFFIGREIVSGKGDVVDLMGFGLMAFAMGYLWWYHRGRTPLDLSADARAYQAAMLARIDRQIGLLSRVRWAAIPLSILTLIVIVENVNMALQ